MILLRILLASLLMVVSPMLIAQEEQSSDELRQQLEELNRDNAALDAQNEELRKRVEELEKETHELTPLALQPEPEPPRKEATGYYTWAALIIALLAGVAGWRFVVVRRRRM